MATIWRVQPEDRPAAASLAREAGIHPLTAQLLINRGVRTGAQARRFLHPSLTSLQDPGTLPDMAEAIRRLKRAVARDEPILIFGDSDVDGLTASVILYEVLQGLGGRVRAVQANRIIDGYGMPETLLRDIRAFGITLVVLVDCGTNQADAVRRLAARGIDTIIVDHHVPLDRWAAPRALVNPHREPDGPWRELCSAALAFKIAQALLGNDRERLSRYADLAALGTLADCSPLTGENRVIVQAGLSRITDSARPGLRRLCEMTATREPEPEHILRKLVPRLNASGRLGDCSAIWRLLLDEPQPALEAWLTAAEAAHTMTKQLHRQILGQAQEQVNRLHFRDVHVIVISSGAWHQGLMGPLASQLAERYNRPAIAIAMQEEQGSGSGRSVPCFDLLRALRECQGLLVRFGGHAQACGLTVNRCDLGRFRDTVNERARETLPPERLAKTRTVDLELSLRAVTRRWVEETKAFAPFGRGNPKPSVLLRQVEIEVVSPRIGWLRDADTRVAVRGTLAGLERQARYDVVATPTTADGELVLTMNDARDAKELSAPGLT